MMAVGFYLLGVIPLFGIALTDLGLIGKNEKHQSLLHATFVGIFLVVAHVAMIFGMLSPSVLGYHTPKSMPTDMSDMQMMDM